MISESDCIFLVCELCRTKNVSSSSEEGSYSAGFFGLGNWSLDQARCWTKGLGLLVQGHSGIILPVWSHFICILCNATQKKILIAFPVKEWERIPPRYVESVKCCSVNWARAECVLVHWRHLSFSLSEKERKEKIAVEFERTRMSTKRRSCFVRIQKQTLVSL